MVRPVNNSMHCFPKFYNNHLGSHKAYPYPPELEGRFLSAQIDSFVPDSENIVIVLFFVTESENTVIVLFFVPDSQQL